MTTTQAGAIPGYLAGTWAIDTVHSEVGFSVRHMMVSKVRGKFTKFSGEIVTAEDPLASSVTAEIDLASIDTGNEQRDGHLRSIDFFDVENHPLMTYRSTGLRILDDGYVLDGDLTIRGVTKSVPLTLEINGFGPDAFGGTRVGFTATGEINRQDFGVSWNAALEAGGFTLGDEVTISIDLQVQLQQAEASAAA